MVVRRRQLPLAIVGSAALFGGCLEDTVGTADVVTPDATAETTADGGADATPDAPDDASTCLEPDDPQTLTGQACETKYEQLGFCDETSNELIVGCAGGIWRSGSELGFDPLACECYGPAPDVCGPEQYSCPVIGYAGITVAGFERRGGTSLRDV